MLLMIHDQWRRFEKKQYYTITRRNGAEDTYYVYNVFRSLNGKRTLKMRHSHGFICYVQEDQILNMEVR